MPTMDKYSWNTIHCIVLDFTQLASIFIQERIDKSLNFRRSFRLSLLCLLKEIGCWVNQFFHFLYLII